jgi:hypothetical protein
MGQPASSQCHHPPKSLILLLLGAIAKAIPSQHGSNFHLQKELDMSSKNTAVFGIYKSRTQAERAVDSVVAAGFSHNDISVLLPDIESSKEFAHEKSTKAPEVLVTVE